MEALRYMSIIFTEPWLILLVAAGTCAGVYVGAIPGLSGTMAVSLLVSFTFGWEQHAALAVMVGVYVGSVFGGSRSAILLNIPGAPAAVATALDGYALAKQGRAGEAMGLATSQSVIGTLLGVLALATCAPLVAGIARNFHSIDYLMLSLMGLMMVGSLSGRSVRFGLIAGCIGIFLGCVGVDGQTAVKRFTFNIVYLNSGVDYVVAMIGLFGASEALSQITDMKATPVKQKVDKILPSWTESLKYLGLTIKSSIIGVLVGALPGAGGDIAALLSYDQAKRSVRNPSAPFGKGAVEGIIAPESANNAAIGGAFIPMLTLGIPGDAVTAVLISALTIQGLRPGPNLISQTPDLFWLIVVCLLAASFFLLVFGLTGIKAFTKIVEIPKGILMPTILILSVIGAYAIRNSVYDILWMFAFGVIGYFLKRFNYPIAPIVLGVILTRLCEENYRRGVMLQGGSVMGMLGSIFTSYISIALFVLLVVLFVTQTETYKNWKAKRNQQNSLSNSSTHFSIFQFLLQRLIFMKIKRAFNYVVNRLLILRGDIRSAKKVREKLSTILSQDGSILDKYGFAQGTDKASIFSGGGVNFSQRIFLAHDYLRHYDFLFQSFRNDKFNLVEFGCLGGSSLRTWKQYFPNVEIYGVDIDEGTKKLEEDRIHILVANAVARSTFDELKNKIGSAFIILDDASHAWGDQRRSFEIFWDLVAPGGFYVIEDLECGSLGAYSEEYPPEVLDSQPFCDYMHDRSKFLRYAPDRAPEKNSYHFGDLPKHIQKIESEMDMCVFIPGAVIVRKKIS